LLKILKEPAKNVKFALKIEFRRRNSSIIHEKLDKLGQDLI
jgi:hypothetical protein